MLQFLPHQILYLQIILPLLNQQLQQILLIPTIQLLLLPNLPQLLILPIPLLPHPPHCKMTLKQFRLIQRANKMIIDKNRQIPFMQLFDVIEF